MLELPLVDWDRLLADFPAMMLFAAMLMVAQLPIVFKTKGEKIKKMSYWARCYVALAIWIGISCVVPVVAYFISPASAELETLLLAARVPLPALGMVLLFVALAKSFPHATGRFLKMLSIATWLSFALFVFQVAIVAMEFNLNFIPALAHPFVQAMNDWAVPGVNMGAMGVLSFTFIMLGHLTLSRSKDLKPALVVLTTAGAVFFPVSIVIAEGGFFSLGGWQGIVAAGIALVGAGCITSGNFMLPLVQDLFWTDSLVALYVLDTSRSDLVFRSFFKEESEVKQLFNQSLESDDLLIGGIGGIKMLLGTAFTVKGNVIEFIDKGEIKLYISSVGDMLFLLISTIATPKIDAAFRNFKDTFFVYFGGVVSSSGAAQDLSPAMQRLVAGAFKKPRAKVRGSTQTREGARE